MKAENENVMARTLAPSEEQVARESVHQVMEEYVRKMQPGAPLDSVTGGNTQLAFWRMIKRVLAHPPQVFSSCWGVILNTVHMNQVEGGAFSPNVAFRYADSIPVSPEEARRFYRMLHLIVQTANPATRAIKLRHISLPLAMDGLPQEHAALLTAFYNDR